MSNGQHPPLTFDQFVGTLDQLGTARSEVPEETTEQITSTVEAIRQLDRIDRDSIAELIRDDPDRVPVLGLAIGLSQEQLKNQLRAQAGTAGWIMLGRNDPHQIVDVLNRDDLGLLDELREQREVTYTWSDVLIARAGTRSRASRAIQRGRDLEDRVEAVVEDLGLSYELRTRFVGRGGRDAPCDLSIPLGGTEALIAVAVKGFDSTGSKLTDAVREVQEMAQVRHPRQYVFAVVDGIGWLGRQSDLQQLYALWEQRSIDGLYTLARFDEFDEDLTDAAIRLGLV